MSIFGSQPGQPRYSGTLHNLSITESVFGTVLPIVFGTTRVHAKLLDYNGFQAVMTNEAKGFFGKGDIATYSANIAAALAQGPCQALLSIWDQSGKLANQSQTVSYTVPSGGGSFTPQTSPAIQYNAGVTAAVAYSVTVNDYGSSGETTYSGVQNVPLTQVANPTTEYEYSFSNGTYTFPAAAAGLVLTITYNSVFSLYYFTQTQAAEIPLGSPYQVTTDNKAYWWSDGGVRYVDTGEPLAAVDTTPTEPGTYHTIQGIYTFAPGDAGRYVYITYTYTSSDSTLTPASSQNITFFSGAQGQQPWSFFVSNYPASAFGYSGICYIGANPMSMGESPTLPSYNYEIVGQCIAPAQFDADVTEVITLLLTNPLCGVNFPSGALASFSLAQSYWGANGFFISDCLTTQQAVSDTIKTWLDAGNVAAVMSGGLLKLIPYGEQTCVGNGYTYTPQTQPAFTLTNDDILPWKDAKSGKSTQDDPIQINRLSARDAYNYVQCQYSDRTNDYNNVLLDEQNDAFIRSYGLRMEGSQSWNFLTSQSVAAWALNLRLKRNLYKRNTYKFNLPFTFSALEPMDIVVLPSGEAVRVTEIEDDAEGALAITAEQFAYGSAFGTIYTKQTPSSYKPNISQAVPGNTSAYIFEATPQSVLAQPNTLQIAVAGQSPSWGGCDVYVSNDGETYGKFARVLSSNFLGLLSAALPAASDPDTTDTLSVDMTLSGGELPSATQAQADAFATLCAIVDAAGTMELVSYETATLTGADRYNLTYLRRGVYGTTIGAHAIGAEFVYLGSTGVLNYQYPAQYAGKTIYFKFPAFNLMQGQEQALSACQAVEFTIPGTTLQPPSSGSFTTNPTNPLSASTANATQAYVTCDPFTAMLNGQSVSCLPAGAWTSAAVNPGELYYCYYIDLGFAGGAITPILTQSQYDFLNKPGYYLIGEIITPPYSGSPTWYPTNYQDIGTSSTSSPAAPYSQNPNNWAVVSGYGKQIGEDTVFYLGECLWLGFPNITPVGDTLSVVYEVSAEGTNNSGTIRVSFDGGNTYTVEASFSTAVAKTTLNVTVPSGTNLDDIVVEVTAGINTLGDFLDVWVYSINVNNSQS